jgi:putative SOS response-associated peptidase YedK
MPIVRFDPKARERTVDIARWGVIPYWAKDIKIGFSTINARAEEIDTRPAFRKRSVNGGTWCRSAVSMNGKRHRPASIPTRSG